MDSFDDSQTTRRQGRGRQVLVRVALALVVVTAVFLLGGGWYFSDQIRADALEVDPATDEMTLQVVSASATSVTLVESGSEQDPLRGDDVYGLAWPTGYGQVSGVPDVTGSEVTRRFVLLSGAAPTPGQPATLDRDAFPDQPAVALDGPIRQVTYSSPAGELSAWLAPGDDSTWAILIHGQRASRDEVLRAMRVTTSVGMPSLAITYRNDQGAPGDPSGFYGFGSTEWRDLEGAVRYATDHGADKVVLVGYSMGGAIAAAFLEHSTRTDDVAAVVFDAPMLDFGATINHKAADRELPLIGLPLPPPLTWTAKQIAGVRFDVDWDEVNYLDDSDWLTVPTLVFHGDHDATVPLSTSQQLADAHTQLVSLVVVPGAEHVASWNSAPSDYDQTLETFLTENQ